MRFAGWIAAILMIMGAGAARADLTISAAISLKPALEKAQGALEKAVGEKIVYNFGASGTLELQIEQGAPVDLFISADRPTVTKLLAARGESHAEKGTDKAIAGNELVLIWSPLSSYAPKPGFGDLTKAHKLAIGDPKIVPAGAYAQEVLTHLKLWDELEKSNKLVLAENVAQVLTFVRRGDAEAGLVYATDAMNAGAQVKVVGIADPSMHRAIEYVSVVVAGSKNPEAAVKAQQALLSADVQAVLKGFGFTPPPGPASTAPEAVEKK